MTKILNRVGMLVSTIGQGTITAAVPISNKFLTPGEAGAVDGEQYFWLLEEGNDFEIFKGTWTASGTTISRDEVIASKISGVAGTTKMTLAGGATLRSALPKEGVAQGWTLIESIAASGANNRVFDNIPDAYSDLMIIGTGLGIAADNAGVHSDVSVNNGSSYLSAIDNIGVADVANEGAAQQIFFGCQLPIAMSVSTADSFGLASIELSSRINAIKVYTDPNDGSPNFTAGTFRLYGR